MPTRRALARRLGVVEDFQDPSPTLEQYATSAEVAASLVHVADQRGDLAGDDGAGATVLDLGTGTGMLALAAALRGPRRVVGIDVDPSPLRTARENAARVGATADVEWVAGDATDLPLAFDDRVVVLSNPPFGAQDGNEHADRAFLDQVRDVASVSYTVHNAGSEDFVRAYADDAGATVTDAFAVELDVDNQFDFHDRATAAIDAEAFRIEWNRTTTERE
ncbi:METTL5 family protein [Halorubellus sp. PRR65]|uniref:METTL5 family protein n=1 Tax=Halorubellus sp. PRR65 TaxID=3098148 RepID=UPI002B261824|nr:METTL5 family protein [Halorubellus sp. PRR65]